MMPDTQILGDEFMAKYGPGKSHPTPEARAAAERSYPTPKVRGGGWEEQPHVQGAVAAWAQEGWEELLHDQGQEGQWWGDTLRPR